MDSCHGDMAYPGVADGGDGLQVWRLAAYIYIYIEKAVADIPQGVVLQLRGRAICYQHLTVKM